MTDYRLVHTPVRGGESVAGIWNADAAASELNSTVLAFHGITASHVSWLAVARELADHRFIAPDLRGRGGSRSLPGPFGMRQHATDALALLDSLAVERADIIGHSMGGFVAMRFAADHPDRVRSVTLVDGGIPLQLPPGIPIEQVMAAALGPALARLAVTYPNREEYHEFWRAHPSFVGEWNDDVEAYVDYDLVGEAPGLRASANADAVLADAVEQGTGTQAEQPWEVVDAPLAFLRAPRGLLNADPLYEADYARGFLAAHPAARFIEVPDINHYTIVMNPRGAGAVADAVRSAASSDTPKDSP